MCCQKLSKQSANFFCKWRVLISSVLLCQHYKSGNFFVFSFCAFVNREGESQVLHIGKKLAGSQNMGISKKIPALSSFLIVPILARKLILIGIQKSIYFIKAIFLKGYHKCQTRKISFLVTYQQQKYQVALVHFIQSILSNMLKITEFLGQTKLVKDIYETRFIFPHSKYRIF